MHIKDLRVVPKKVSDVVKVASNNVNVIKVDADVVHNVSNVVTKVSKFVLLKLILNLEMIDKSKS